MIVNFTKLPVQPLTIEGEEIETVTHFKYLGVYFDNKLTGDQHVKSIVSKCNQRLYLQRQYASFGATTAQLDHMFRTMMLSVILYACVSYYSVLSQKNKAKLQRIARKAKANIIIEHVVEGIVLKYAKAVASDRDHLLYMHFILARSGRRFLVPKCNTERKRKSFIFNALKLLNNDM
jgi:hypothetical protein